MFRFSSGPVARILGLTVLLGSLLFASEAISEVQYNVRAQTKDKITATIRNSEGFIVSGKARQGSFGAPSINDKGAVAYACILSGPGIGAFSSNSIVVRLAGKKAARVALQANTVVDDSFLPPVAGNSFAVSGSGQMYRMSRDVAINKKNQVAFAGQLLYVIATPENDAPTSFAAAETSVYGEVIPTSKKAVAFTNVGLVSYLNFFDDIFTKTISINSAGSTAFNADVQITPNKSVPGFGFSSPTGETIVATTESPAIGLSFFTTFDGFSDAIVANNNITFVVADISDDGDAFDGIWQGNNPDIQPVVVKNTDVPGGGTFQTFEGKVGPSRNGKLLAFLATGSTGGKGAFRSSVKGEDIVAVAKVADSAPGTDGKTFTAIDLAAANNGGQVAVLASIVDSSGIARSGIWLSDKNGANLQLIALEGGTISVGGAEKQISKLAFNPVSGLNAKGEVAFTASFNDRTSAVIIGKL